MNGWMGGNSLSGFTNFSSLRAASVGNLKVKEHAEDVNYCDFIIR